MELSKECAHQRLVITDRKELSCNSVSSVKDFTGDLLTLNTAYGTVYIEGNGLEIESLSDQSGEIRVKGRIDGVYYKAAKEGGGLFSRIFK